MEVVEESAGPAAAGGGGGGGAAAAAAAAPPAKTDLSNPDFLSKSKEAAQIANQVLQGVLSQVAAGKDIADLCDFGDALVAQLTGQVHKSKKLEKGVAFPTCVSVNECVGHFSPFKSESRPLADGDVVKMCVARLPPCAACCAAGAPGAAAHAPRPRRPNGAAVSLARSLARLLARSANSTARALSAARLLTCANVFPLPRSMPSSDLGVHLDGLIALVAHTTVVGASAAAGRFVTGPHADVLAAAHAAAEIALRLIKPGAKNSAVTAAMERVAEAFGVRAVAGVQMLQLQQFVLEGPKRIALKADKADAEAAKDCVFAADEAYAVDVCFSSGEGRPIEKDARTTVFKRTVDNAYKPKIKASQQLLSEINKRHPTLPFTLRSLGKESEARLGVKECLTHGLVGAYPVLFEKEGAVVAQFRFTVLLLPGGSQKVTGLDLPDFVRSERKLPADLEELRNSVAYVAKAKKAKAAGGEAAAAKPEDAMKE
jgi:curved DNA binding protein